MARLKDEDLVKLDEVIEKERLTHVQVRKESSEEDRLSDLERLEQLGKNLEKQLDLRNSSNSENSGSGNETPNVDVLNDTAFFHEILEHRREAWQSTVITEEIKKNDPIKEGESSQRTSETLYRRST